MGFIARNKLWLGIGSALFMAAVLLFFIWLPQMARSQEALETLQERAQILEQEAREESISEDMIDRQRERKEELNKVLTSMKPVLYEHYTQATIGERLFEDPAIYRWASVFNRLFEREVRRLSHRIKLSILNVPENLFDVRVLDEDDAPEVAHGYEKEQRVREAIFDVILEQNKEFMRIPELRSFSLNLPDQDARPIFMRRLHENEELFDIWPFEIEIIIQSGHVPNLVRGFAESPYRIEIVALDQVTRERAPELVWHEIDTQGAVNAVEQKLEAGDPYEAKKLIFMLRSAAELTTQDFSAFENVEDSVDEALGEEREEAQERIERELEAMEDIDERIAEWVSERNLPEHMLNVTITGYLPEYKRPHEKDLMSELADALEEIENHNFDRAQSLMEQVREAELFEVSEKLKEKMEEVSKQLEEAREEADEDGS